jgi:histone deacetylase 1/2
MRHSIAECWHRFDENYVPDQRLIAAATTSTYSYGVDTNWYIDTGATDHITGELEKLSMKNKYHGGDQIHTASGSGMDHTTSGSSMDISHIGHTTIRTPHCDIHLIMFFLFLRPQKNLISIHRLATDNSAY